jgi:hypothetical protein
MFRKPLVTLFQENSMKRSYFNTSISTFQENEINRSLFEKYFRPGTHHWQLSFKKIKSIKVLFM